MFTFITLVSSSFQWLMLTFINVSSFRDDHDKIPMDLAIDTLYKGIISMY